MKSVWLPDKLPEDLDAEKALLATLCNGALTPDSSFADAHNAVLLCKPEYFVNPVFRLVFEATQRLYMQGAEINALALKGDMEAAKTLARVGDYAGLVEILAAQEVSRPTRLVERLNTLYRARSLISLGARIVNETVEGLQPVDELISQTATALSELSQGKGGAKIEKASALVDRINAGEVFNEPGANSGKLAWFGIPAFDKAVEASAEHVVILAARPGVGKSAFAIQTQWITAKQGIPSLLISLEMNRDELHSRYAAWQTGEAQRAFRSGQWSENAVQELNHARPVLDLVYSWVHPSGVPWPKVEAVIRDSVRVHGVRVVVVDYGLLLQKPNLGKNPNDAACWNAISKNIKRLAQELKICIVNLCQINRAGEGIEPKLSELKETGGWEEDANAVIMLWPKESKAQAEYEFMPEKPIFAKAAKVRSGPSGWKKELKFYGATNRFIEVETRLDSSPEPEGASWVN